MYSKESTVEKLRWMYNNIELFGGKCRLEMRKNKDPGSKTWQIEQI
jgi:hypothetical protein